MNKNPIRRFLRYALSASLLLALIAGAVTVYAAFPGANGKIAFHSDRDGNNEVYVMNADGSGQTNLTNNPAADIEPAWSPDGSKIVFSSARDGDFEIYVMNADGTGQIPRTDNAGSDNSPAWSPDGTQIAFASTRDGDYDIYVMNADGTGQTPLTDNAAFDYGPVWSPDGTKIAFSTDRDGGCCPNPQDHEIYVMDADGTDQTNLTTDSDPDGDPSWSPDGTKITFNKRVGLNHEIYIMNADGTGQTNLTNSAGGEGQTAWSPDGAKIVFSSSRDGDSDIYEMNAADGSSQTNLSNNSAFEDIYPDWQPLPAIYDFSGFFQPVDNLPTLNMVKAGQAIPVKFSLNGDQGLDIFAAGYPKSQSIACDSTTGVDGIEETVTAGSSSLAYDPSTDTYTYVWKTNKAWANTCRQLVLRLDDGTYHQANFKFK